MADDLLAVQGYFEPSESPLANAAERVNSGGTSRHRASWDATVIQRFPLCFGDVGGEKAAVAAEADVAERVPAAENGIRF